MQLEVFLETRETEKALQRGLAHLWDIFEAQVIGNKERDLLGLVIRESEASADFFGHLGADFDVAVEADAAFGAGWRGESRRLADIV